MEMRGFLAMCLGVWEGHWGCLCGSRARLGIGRREVLLGPVGWGRCYHLFADQKTEVLRGGCPLSTGERPRPVA
jgi:hypothetical protein